MFADPFFLLGPQTSRDLVTLESQYDDDHPPMKFTWKLTNLSFASESDIYSDIFVVGGYRWRILLAEYTSLSLDSVDCLSLPHEWAINVRFSLAIVNQMDRRYSIRKEMQRNFNAEDTTWGFTLLVHLRELSNPRMGYYVNDTLFIEAEMCVSKAPDYWSYDSKKETGFVGLKNHDSTCYMNSLLQTLYHIPSFRKAVYHMPTPENDLPAKNITLALQHLFYNLQYGDTSVMTMALTTSFGWDIHHSVTQHDVQEFNRVLFEKLEDKMKGTCVEGTIRNLFEGHQMNYIECINVDYKSMTKQSFYDLQLDVKNCKDVYASFDKYVGIQRFEGDNKYYAEGHDWQDATMGVLFVDFPIVLQLHLNRFEYDVTQGTMVKINDRYEFPLQLDLDRENRKYLSPDSDSSVRNLYTLHSVLVHSGGVHDGHYYVFVRPELSDRWYKFDDERVTIEDAKKAMEEQYGGEEEFPQINLGVDNPPLKFTECSNAYMLVYIRESERDKVICSIEDEDIAEHLRVTVNKELKEDGIVRRYNREGYLLMTVKVATDEDLYEQLGKDIFFDLVDHETVHSFQIPKKSCFRQLKMQVAEELDVPMECQRYWIWDSQLIDSFTSLRPLWLHEEFLRVGELKDRMNKAGDPDLKLFLEVEYGHGSHPVAPPNKSGDDLLIFFKLYDAVKVEMRYVGRLRVKADSNLMDIIGNLNHMADFIPDQEIDLFKEIRFQPIVLCQPLDKMASFTSEQIRDGEIIWYQKALTDEERQYRYSDVPSFIKYLQERQVVHFRALEKPDEDDIVIELSKLQFYDEVVETVADMLGLDDPTKIRLTGHNSYTQAPELEPMKYREHFMNKKPDLLYYEVLDIPLPVLERLKCVKVAFHHATSDEVVIHNIRLPSESTVADVLNELKTKVDLSHPDAELRLLVVILHKIYKIYPLTDIIEPTATNGPPTLRAEEIPEDQKNIGFGERLIHVCHFTCDSSQSLENVKTFGEPFFLAIHGGETLAEIKVRIQKKLQVSDEEFSKWRFAFMSWEHQEYLRDTHILYNWFPRRDMKEVWEEYLGLEHSENSINQNQSMCKAAVRIYD